MSEQLSWNLWKVKLEDELGESDARPICCCSFIRNWTREKCGAFKIFVTASAYEQVLPLFFFAAVTNWTVYAFSLGLMDDQLLLPVSCPPLSLSLFLPATRFAFSVIRMRLLYIVRVSVSFLDLQQLFLLLVVFYDNALDDRDSRVRWVLYPFYMDTLLGNTHDLDQDNLLLTKASFFRLLSNRYGKRRRRRCKMPFLHPLNIKLWLYTIIKSVFHQGQSRRCCC